MASLLGSLLAVPAWRTHLEHGCLKLLTDSKVAASDVARMCSPAAPIHQQLLALYALAAAHDIEIQVEWRPREHPLLQCADSMSKVTDVADWGLSPAAFSAVVAQLGCPAPRFDWFAAPWNAKAAAFASRVLMPGAALVNAFDHCWQLPGGGLSLICPPPSVIPRVLSKLEADRASCILILPAWLHAWHGQLGLLPIDRSCSVPGTLIEWGPRAPSPPHRSAALHAGLRAYLVRFPSSEGAGGG